MLKSLAAMATLLACFLSPAKAGDIAPPLPHKTTLKTGADCHTPQGKSRKACAPAPH